MRDEAHPLAVLPGASLDDAAAAARCHADPEVHAVTARLFQIARVTSRRERRAPVRFAPAADSTTGARVSRPTAAPASSGVSTDLGPADPERRQGTERRIGPRRLRDRAGEVDLVAAARRAREHADAAFSHFKVGAALETADGTVITGCNIENATYGLTICAERVAMFKALSEGHRAFTRIAIVADTEAPTPPCGACRQILWEFGGNLEVQLANLSEKKGAHRAEGSAAAALRRTAVVRKAHETEIYNLELRIRHTNP